MSLNSKFKKYSVTNFFWRESTREWVYEVSLNIPTFLTGTYRYSSKFKMIAYIKFILYKGEILQDIEIFGQK